MESFYKFINTKDHCNCKESEISNEIVYQCSIDGSCEKCPGLECWFNFIDGLNCKVCQKSNKFISIFDKVCEDCKTPIDINFDKNTIKFISVADSQNDWCDQCDTPALLEYEVSKISNSQELDEINYKRCSNLERIYREYKYASTKVKHDDNC